MAVSTTGSRNGIITWAVASTILGFGSLIWAVISFTQANKADKDYKAIEAKYAKVIDVGGLTGGEDVNALTEAVADPTRGFTPDMKLLTVARRQTQQLTALVAGAGVTSDKDAAAAAARAIQDAQKAATGADGKPAAIDSSSLVSAVKSLTSYATGLKKNNDQLASDLKAAQAAAAAAEAEKGQVATISDDKVNLATKQVTDSQANADSYGKSKDEQLAGAQKLAADKAGEGIKTADELNGQLNAIRQDNARIKRELDDRNAQLKNFRVPTDQILRQADGVITRTGGTDRVFINLGAGDHVAAGLTFEVYDRLGAPRVPQSDNPTDDKLLKGKASIEVVTVRPGISECRVVRLSPGAAITEGDPIVNVVYDKNVKFNFLVFGKFNLDYKGVPTERDTDIVRRLISGWGATVVDQLSAKTDFVVLGDEPVVPNYTQDQLAREPEKAFEKEQAEQALEAYTDIRAKANQLNIPILNQTRFLYMIGYYEEAGR